MSRLTRPQLERKWRGQLDDYVTAIAWSPDSQHVAACDGSGTVQCLNRSSKQTHCLQTGTGESIDALTYSSNGNFLAASGQNGHVLVWDMRGETPILNASLDHPNTWVDRLAWHPQRSELALSLGRYAQIWDAESQEIITTLAFDASSVLDMAWHPEKHWLAVGGHQGIKIWQDWDEEPIHREIPASSLCVDWSPDGQYLATGNLDRTLVVWPWNQDMPWRMTGFPGKVRQLAWSGPFGNEESPILAAASGTCVTTWQRQGDGWEAEMLDAHTQPVNAIAFQPNGTLLTSTAGDGYLCLWLNGYKLIQAEEDMGGSVLAWSPDGQALAFGGQEGEWQLWTLGVRGRGFS